MPRLRLLAEGAVIALSILLQTAPAGAQAITNLHNFTAGPGDGQNPGSSLSLVGSTLLGMTNGGGSANDGTIFSLGLDGSNYSAFHSFTGGINDGGNPTGALTPVLTTVYGMTQGGGNSLSDGTVFKINADGSGFNVVHPFVGAPNDGSSPLGSVAVVGQTIYGMTLQGGTANLGTVFKMNTDGTSATVLHSFTGGTNDGQSPSISSLVRANGVLYGMTPTGGAFGFGTVFKINIDGSGFTLLHSFNANTGDGWSPLGSLSIFGTTLYGMTRQGGGGAGTVFQINIDGSGYGTIHTFTGQSTGDGANPVGTLLLSGSTLYGTTPTGGADNLGTIFGINTDGSNYGRLYSFTGGTNDGANPSDLISSGSTFYGMTGAGGASDLGTVFSFTPVPEPSTLTLTVGGVFFALLAACRARRFKRACLS